MNCVDTSRKIDRAKVRLPAGFTLVELLVVIAIIGVLAALLLPVFHKSGGRAKKGRATIEMQDLAAAILQYESAYKRFPYTLDAADGRKDGTFGFTGTDTASAKAFPKNSEIMIALMDLNEGANLNHVKNPQRESFFHPRMVSTTNQPGLSTVDHQFRDPWGNPYVITLDLNFDEKCRDAQYGRQSVSRNPAAGANGYFGLYNPVKPAGDSDDFELNDQIMIWSLGTDGKFDAGPANAGDNKDNVLGWQ